MNTEKLTLETLATAAQQGKREVLPLLWEKTERLIKKLILKTINKRILPTHIEESDVLQCGYFALLAAVRAFKNSGLMPLMSVFTAGAAEKASSRKYLITKLSRTKAVMTLKCWN